MINCFRMFDENGDGTIAEDELGDTVFQFFLITLDAKQVGHALLAMHPTT